MSGILDVGRTFLIVDASGLKRSDTTPVLTDSVLTRLPRLAEAISITEQRWQTYANACKAGGCPDMTPGPATVVINETDFRIINATFKPKLIDEVRKPAQAIEVHKITQELPGGKARVIEEKIAVNRPPNPGEEFVPARVERRYEALVFYNGIEYHLFMWITWKLP